jgi:hypothetical protein
VGPDEEVRAEPEHAPALPSAEEAGCQRQQIGIKKGKAVIIDSLSFIKYQ